MHGVFIRTRIYVFKQFGVLQLPVVHILLLFPLLQVGRERHSTFCLMQKYVDLQSMGKTPQIVSAFAAEHVKGAIFIEAYKKNDIYEV